MRLCWDPQEIELTLPRTPEVSKTCGVRCCSDTGGIKVGRLTGDSDASRSWSWSFCINISFFRCCASSLRTWGWDPHWYTVPSTDIARQWKYPVDTCRTGASRTTLTGTNDLSVCPEPSWPYKPKPNDQISPCSVRHKEWAYPAATWTTTSLERRWTTWGSSTSSKCPCPSWPWTPQPHEYTRPLESRAREWNWPAEIWTMDSRDSRIGLLLWIIFFPEIDQNLIF